MYVFFIYATSDIKHLVEISVLILLT